MPKCNRRRPSRQGTTTEAIPLKTPTDLVPALRVRTVMAALALSLCALFAFAAPASAAVYDPLDVIPYDTWRASSSMSEADIQAFLAGLSGPLKSVVATDYAGIPKKTAARIIWEAARGWNLNPKVILSTLQKEQSLLTVSNTKNAARLVKAMGCGVYGAIDPKTGLTTNRYPGFGSQIWNGARVLSTYEITYHWVPNMQKNVTAYKTVSGERVAYSTHVHPKNASTFALYTYTPYYPQKLVWDIYTRYFGDPHASPQLRPVYRFRNRSNGTYYYTSSEAKRYTLIAKSASTWSYGGVAFTIDTSATANASPLYRMYNSRTHSFAYTTSAASRDRLLASHPHVWSLSGSVGNVARSAALGAPVYRLDNKSTHGVLLTQSKTAKTTLTSGRNATFVYRGIAFYLATSIPATEPVGP